VIRLRILANELRKAKRTGKPVIPLPLCDLKLLIEFAARDAGTSNRRHQGRFARGEIQRRRPGKGALQQRYGPAQKMGKTDTHDFASALRMPP
jgi:hypothetical protein